MFYEFDAAEDPSVIGDIDVLTEDERTLGLAYIRLAPLLEELQEKPFARHLYARLRDYLDEQAWEAADAFERLREKGPDYLTSRLAELGPEMIAEDLA